MKYQKDKSVNKKQPTHNRQKGEEAAKYDQAANEQDIQPEGAKYKGVKHKGRSGSQREEQSDMRTDE